MAVMPKYYKIHTDGCTVELEPIYEELVPVVRCKDCKHWEDGWLGYCIKCHTAIPYDGFCSYGERKEADGK